MNCKGICTLMATLIFLIGCKDDDYVYPPVLTEIISVRISETGSIQDLNTDKGASYRVENGSRFTGYSPDSLYRMVCIYELHEATAETTAQIYSVRNTVSPIPILPERLIGDIKTDPVNVQSIWRSGDYLNVILLVKIQNGKHLFHFIETGNEEEAGSHKIDLTLYHDKQDDVEGYSQRAYLSVPLKQYNLTASDSVFFTLNTYKQGFKTYAFAY